jgi:hypothetical protein
MFSEISQFGKYFLFSEFNGGNMNNIYIYIYIIVPFSYMSQNSSVGIALGYRLDDRGSIPGRS